MWKYIPLLNVMIQILVTIGLGGVMQRFRILEAKDFVPLAVRFVFYVSLPCLVIKALGIGIDFYSESNIWSYICAFLLLRVIALICSLLIILAYNWKAPERVFGLGHVVVIWLTLTWISTVIMGVPISSAVFGDGSLGRKYGILAAISSFIFQLPLMLVFLESYALDKEDCVDDETNQTEEHNQESLVCENEEASATDEGEVELATAISCDNNAESLEVMEAAPEHSSKPCITRQAQEEWWHLAGQGRLNHAGVWLEMTKRILKNPVLWGISIGFILTLSTVGPTYLNPASPNYVQGLGWINLTLTWFGDIVSPLSLFAMGMWMQAQGIHKLVFAVSPWKLAISMIAKLVLVPLVMVVLAKALLLNNQMGRAAVLIASLPISLASFSLGKQYSIGEAVLSANVAVGTILMLPTVLVWNVVMDALGLFPIE